MNEKRLEGLKLTFSGPISDMIFGTPFETSGQNWLKTLHGPWMTSQKVVPAGPPSEHFWDQKSGRVQNQLKIVHKT